MNTLRCFPHESKNFRRGSDVPEDGESNGVARLTFSRLDFESPAQVEEEERVCGSNGWEKSSGTLGLAAGYL
jgi:hypothetical protein